MLFLPAPGGSSSATLFNVPPQLFLIWISKNFAAKYWIVILQASFQHLAAVFPRKKGHLLWNRESFQFCILKLMSPFVSFCTSIRTFESAKRRKYYVIVSVSEQNCPVFTHGVTVVQSSKPLNELTCFFTNHPNPLQTILSRVFLFYLLF